MVPVFLGQAGGGSASSVMDAVVWILLLVACCLVLGVILMRLRKRFFGEPEGDAGEVFPLSDLRRLRDGGELSEDEYRRAVDVLAGRVKSGGGDARSE